MIRSFTQHPESLNKSVDQEVSPAAIEFLNRSHKMFEIVSDAEFEIEFNWKRINQYSYRQFNSIHSTGTWTWKLESVIYLNSFLRIVLPRNKCPNISPGLSRQENINVFATLLKILKEEMRPHSQFGFSIFRRRVLGIRNWINRESGLNQLHHLLRYTKWNFFSKRLIKQLELPTFDLGAHYAISMTSVYKIGVRSEFFQFKVKPLIFRWKCSTLFSVKIDQYQTFPFRIFILIIFSHSPSVEMNNIWYACVVVSRSIFEKCIWRQ